MVGWGCGDANTDKRKTKHLKCEIKPVTGSLLRERAKKGGGENSKKPDGETGPKGLGQARGWGNIRRGGVLRNGGTAAKRGRRKGLLEQVYIKS